MNRKLSLSQNLRVHIKFGGSLNVSITHIITQCKKITITDENLLQLRADLIFIILNLLFVTNIYFTIILIPDQA